jgi:hypothetical protein
MPHAVYHDPFLLCPWPGCDVRIGIVDFCLEKMGMPALYARVMLAWGRQTGYGLVGRCPGCGQYVWFGENSKRALPDPPAPDLEVLPDHWAHVALIV